MSEPATAAKAAPVTVFVSYARADRRIAARVVSALGRAGFTAWWDALIEGGASFASTIDEALERADAVVVLWSKTSCRSDWVRDEAARGRDRHRLVPLSIDGSQPPLGFRQYQVIDLSHWRGKASTREMQTLVHAICTVAGHEHCPPAAAAPSLSRRDALAATAATAAVVVGGGALVAWDRGLLGGKADGSDRIAVLPFKNLSGDPSQSYLSDGVTEEVRAALIRNPSLQVLAATSSSGAGADGVAALHIARKLVAAYLLGGAVRRSGNLLRISAELTDGRTGVGLWATTLDRKMTDIFAVEEEIARTVSEALSVRLATAEPAPGGTTNVTAYEYYLRGRSLFNEAKDETTDRQALSDYELAIAADPKFAMAYAARSRSLAAIAAEYGKADQLHPLYNAAIESARRAVALAPALADGHLALGYALFSGRLDIDGAAPSYARAYELGRGNADILLLFALYCSRAGRATEARAAIQRALVLDPLNPRTYRAAGSIDYAARHYASAFAPLRQALTLNPDMTYAQALIGSCLLQLGRLQEARAAFAAEPLAAFRWSGLAIVDQRLGDRRAADDDLRRLVSELGDGAAYQQAEVHAQWGEPDAAIAALQRARLVGDSGLTYAATDPLLDPIRARPDFASFLKQMRLG